MAFAIRRGTTSTRRAIKRAIRRQRKPIGVRRRNAPQPDSADSALQPSASSWCELGDAVPVVSNAASVAMQYRDKVQWERRRCVHLAVAGITWFAVTVGFAAICLHLFA